MRTKRSNIVAMLLVILFVVFVCWLESEPEPDEQTPIRVVVPGDAPPPDGAQPDGERGVRVMRKVEILDDTNEVIVEEKVLSFKPDNSTK